MTVSANFTVAKSKSTAVQLQTSWRCTLCEIGENLQLKIFCAILRTECRRSIGDPLVTDDCATQKSQPNTFT
jgi:hypothetical protein